MGPQGLGPQGLLGPQGPTGLGPTGLGLGPQAQFSYSVADLAAVPQTQFSCSVAERDGSATPAVSAEEALQRGRVAALAVEAAAVRGGTVMSAGGTVMSAEGLQRAWSRSVRFDPAAFTVCMEVMEADDLLVPGPSPLRPVIN